MWQIEFTKGADKDFSKLTPEFRKRIDKAIEEKLLSDPETHLKALVDRACPIITNFVLETTVYYA